MFAVELRAILPLLLRAQPVHLQARVLVDIRRWPPPVSREYAARRKGEEQQQNNQMNWSQLISKYRLADRATDARLRRKYPACIRPSQTGNCVIRRSAAEASAS